MARAGPSGHGLPNFGFFCFFGHFIWLLLVFGSWGMVSFVFFCHFQCFFAISAWGDQSLLEGDLKTKASNAPQGVPQGDCSLYSVL